MNGLKLEESSSQYLTRTSDLFSFNSPYTVMLWVYPDTDPGANWTTLTTLNNESSSDLDLIQANWNVATPAWELYISYGDFGGGVGSAVQLNAWQHLTIVRNSVTDIRLYRNGVQDIADTTFDVTGRSSTMNNFSIGCTNPAGSPLEFFDGRIAFVKAWTTNLTAAEIAREVYSGRPVRTANLYGWWPEFDAAPSSVTDFSGNGRAFTATGSPTGADGPPVSWGSPVLWLPFAGAAAPSTIGPFPTFLHQA